MKFSISAITDKIVLHGRCAMYDNKLNTDWVGGGFTCRFKGDSIKIFFETEADEAPVYVKCILDEKTEHQKTEKHSVCNSDDIITIDNLNYGEHTLKLVRITEVLDDRTKTKQYLNTTHIEISAYEPNAGEAELLSAKKTTKYTFDFYGDSITNGWAGLADENEVNFNIKPCHSDHSITYAYKVSERLNADARVCAVSGHGIIAKWDGDLSMPIKNFYQKQSLILPIKPDFSEKPDLIVVALGTNDACGGVSDNDMKNGILDFVQMLRNDAPDTEIIWYYGMMNQTYIPLMTKLFEELSKDDKHISFLPVKNITLEDKEFAGCGHPNKKAQLRFADTLEEHIKSRLGI